MSDRQPLSEAEVELILEHNSRLIIAADNARLRLQQIVGWKENKLISGQANYWRNAAAALRWSSSIARQRQGKSKSAEKTAV